MAIGTPVTIVAFTSGVASGGTVTTTAAAAPGSLIVVLVASFSGTNTAFSGTLSDSAGNSYLLAKTSAASSTLFASGIYYCSNSKVNLPSGGTITMPTQVGCTWQVMVVKVSGANGGLDKTATQENATAVTSYSFATGALTSTSEIVFGVNDFNNVLSTYTEGTGFTELQTNANVIAHGFDPCYDIVSANTTVTWAPSFTSSQYTAVLASFRATPALYVPLRQYLRR